MFRDIYLAEGNPKLTPVGDEPCKLICNASDYAIGIVPEERFDKKPQVTYYGSYTLNDA